MIKKGYYFTNTNLFNKRAHSLQISKTIESVNDVGKVALVLVAPKYSKDLVETAFDYYGVKNKFEVIFLKIFLFRKATKLSFVFFTIRACFFVINKKIKRQIDFIYFRSEYFIYLGYLAKFLKIPFYYEIHRRGLSDKENKIKESLAKLSSGVITITKGLGEYYSKFNSNMVVAHDAVDLDRFKIDISKEEARDMLNLPQSKKIAVYVGSVKVVKGVDIISRNAKYFPEILFLIVGKVDSSFGAEDSDNLKFIGQINNDLVPVYLTAADFLILPHPDTIQSQSPMKLFEYMAVNRPIISSKLDNIMEVLNQSENLFFKPDSDDDYKRAIKYFIDNLSDIDINNDLEIKNYTWEYRGIVISSILI